MPLIVLSYVPTPYQTTWIVLPIRPVSNGNLSPRPTKTACPSQNGAHSPSFPNHLFPTTPIYHNFFLFEGGRRGGKKVRPQTTLPSAPALLHVRPVLLSPLLPDILRYLSLILSSAPLLSLEYLPFTSSTIPLSVLPFLRNTPDFHQPNLPLIFC